MAVSSPAKRNTGYLKLKTDIDQDDAKTLQTGLLTPISANYGGRRPSLTSGSWSFLSSISSPTSHASSVSSFYSSQDPSTPPRHGLAIDSNMALVAMDISGPNASVKADYRTPLMGTQLPMMPAAADFSRALRAGLANSHGGSPQRLEPNGSCYGQDYLTAPVYLAGHYDDLYHDHVAEESGGPSYTVEDTGTSPWLASSSNMGIVPTQTIVRAPMTLCSQPIPDFGMPITPIHEMADEGGFNRFTDDDDQRLSDLELELSDISTAHSSFSTTIVTSPTGAKGVKRQKKRKSKTVGSTYRWNNRAICVPLSIQPQSKRHECGYVLEDNSVCGKKFRRVEHLRRHVDGTHTGDKYYPCPDPACRKKFRARADNAREHFKTHLKVPASKRSKSSRSFEQFYEFIRCEYPDDATKMIAKLEKWRSDGGHLKTEVGAGRKAVGVKRE